MADNFLSLQLNFYGLQLFKSNSDEFWPILGFFHEVETSPFLIGLAYCKKGKPNINNFLGKLVKECKELNIEGEYLKKMTFSGIVYELRNNDLFRKKTNLEHHIGSSPLLELKIDMVSDFPADFMHVVCLGVVRRLMKMWKDGF